MKNTSALADWSAEEIALGKKWVETWQLAAKDLERIRRKEIRELDTYQTLLRLCGPRDYTRPPYARDTGGVTWKAASSTSPKRLR